MGQRTEPQKEGRRHKGNTSSTQRDFHPKGTSLFRNCTYKLRGASLCSFGPVRRGHSPGRLKSVGEEPGFQNGLGAYHRESNSNKEAVVGAGPVLPCVLYPSLVFCRGGADQTCLRIFQFALVSLSARCCGLAPRGPFAHAAHCGDPHVCYHICGVHGSPP